MATYILKSAVSDIVPIGSDSRVLSQGAEASSTVTKSITPSTISPVYGYTPIGSPNNASWDAGDTTVEVSITSASSNIWLKVSAGRSDSAGNTIETTSFSPEVQLSATGLYTLTIPSMTWTAGSSSDRLFTYYEFRNAASSGGSSSITFEVGTPDQEVITSFSDLVPLPITNNYLFGGYGIAYFGGSYFGQSSSLQSIPTEILEIADSSSNSSVASISLEQKHTLAVNGITSASTVDSPSLVQKHALTVQDSVSASFIDNVALTQSITLSVADSASTSVLDGAIITQKHVLAVNETTSGSLLDSVIMVQKSTLIVEALASASTADNVALAEEVVLAVQDATSTSSLDNVTLTITAITLVVNDATSSSSLDSVSLVLKYMLSVDNLASASLTDVVSLVEKNHLITQDLTSASLLDHILFSYDIPPEIGVNSYTRARKVIDDITSADPSESGTYTRAKDAKGDFEAVASSVPGSWEEL